MTDLAIPAWARYVTIQPDGRICCYEREPRIGNPQGAGQAQWMPEPDSQCMTIGDVSRQLLARQTPPIFTGWRDCLIALDEPTRKEEREQ